MTSAGSTWYVWQEEHGEFGPFSREQLLAAAKAGSIDGSMWLRKGDQAWQPAHQVIRGLPAPAIPTAGPDQAAAVAPAPTSEPPPVDNADPVNVFAAAAERAADDDEPVPVPRPARVSTETRWFALRLIALGLKIAAGVVPAVPTLLVVLIASLAATGVAKNGVGPIEVVTMFASLIVPWTLGLVIFAAAEVIHVLLSIEESSRMSASQ